MFVHLVVSAGFGGPPHHSTPRFEVTYPRLVPDLLPAYCVIGFASTPFRLWLICFSVLTLRRAYKTALARDLTSWELSNSTAHWLPLPST